MSNTNFGKLDQIKKFVKESKIFVNDDLLTFKNVNDAGVGIFAKEDIPEDTIIVKIPKTAIFTAKNCTISNLLDDKDIDGIMGIHLAVLYELFIFKGEKSHWFDYLSFIFEDVLKHNIESKDLYLPPGYWSQQEKDYLKGTLMDVQYQGLKTHDDILSVYIEFVRFAYEWKKDCDLDIPEILQNEYIANLPDDGDYDLKEIETHLLTVNNSFLRFIEIGYVISSRVFEIDYYHQFGLVCIVDLFNHNFNEDIHFESEYEVCEVCGKTECAHLHVPDSDDEDAEEDSNNEDSCEDEDEVIEDELNDEGNNENEVESDDECEIRAIHEIEKGKEIFNTYGQFPNSALLLKYGFVIPNNPLDKVALWNEFDQVAKDIDHLNDSDVEERLSWWKQEGLSLLEEELDAIDELEEMEDQELSDDENNVSSDHSEDEEYEEDSLQEGDEEDEDDEVDKETFWKDQIFLDASGEASPYLERLCVILSMSKDQFHTEKLQFNPEKLEDVKSNEIKPVLSLALKLLKKIVSKKKLFRIPEETEKLPNFSEMKKILLIENDIILRAKENFGLD
ncbi:uncharacterized protein HGUI_01070 [Hanseniaspora guilliermondii]|uniref:SET domain-containing protein n=1 Tax=Hanseniaspora guilliermondii TaxID=56406 RepID=A0A1L0FH13_9ASCO|nr:uncharacterized protein HGUI_01070 [Hanseniaspora guilliermondii]